MYRDSYEAHVKGFTRQHQGVPSELRGTYLGICHPPILEHLKSLGVTSVPLMPVAAVKGFTRQHQGVPSELRGTYLGICHPPIIEHLKSLGVTSVQLMPVAA
ncbi:hypothetical protein ACQ4LF_23315, partial [Aeromonas salmonicida]